MVRGLVALSLLCVLVPSASALDARKCGRSGSRCEVLAQGLENARSISRIQPDGTFFVGTAGNAQTDLIGELISDRTPTPRPSTAIPRPVGSSPGSAASPLNS